jgi:EAL domain-containing protein (putative c-di-GMP-specific phosphodiesterase class I)
MDSSNKNLFSNLKKEILNKNFNIAYQPIVSTKEGKVKSLESLFRLKDARFNTMIEDVIKFAEDEGLLNTITEFMLDNIIEDFDNWRSKNFIEEDFLISINISPSQLNEELLIFFIDKTKDRKITPNNIYIEITETKNVSDSNIEIINELYKLGFKIALDDFGTGFSSLTHLIKMPYHMVKIDKNFIKNILENKSMEKELIKMIVGLGKNADFSVVCEGIETESQAKVLDKINCDYQQGFLYSKPVYKTEIISTIKNINKNNIKTI